jgi:hypothetical protein
MNSSSQKPRTRYVIRVVPHHKQRYETVGDWIPGEPVKICVSKMKDERYIFLVAIHELIEYELCRMKGISDEQVLEFDSMFEQERSVGLQRASSEPGDDPRAPYKKEHAFATDIERLVAQKLGVRWSDYEEAALALDPRTRLALGQQERRRQLREKKRASKRALDRPRFARQLHSRTRRTLLESGAAIGTLEARKHLGFPPLDHRRPGGPYSRQPPTSPERNPIKAFIR